MTGQLRGKLRAAFGVAGLWWWAPATALILSLVARHALVQAPGMAAQCEAHPMLQPCVWRSGVIQAFVDHRLSTTALALALGAWGLWCVARLSGGLHPAWVLRAAALLASLGLAVAICGLVLYDADRSAWAALLCGVCGVKLRAQQASQRCAKAGGKRDSNGHTGAGG